MSKKVKDKGVKSFLGLPMRWDRKNMLKDIWDPQDDRVFPPKHFGIGWGLNFHAVLKRAGIVKSSK